MSISVMAMGRMKEKPYRQMADEDLKRLSRYGKYEIVAVDDVREPDHPSEALLKQGMEKEGAALMKHIRPNDRVVCLCIRANAPDSVGLARLTGGWMNDGRRTVFVIGGSNGLSDEVLRRADERLSFSNLTFPHGLMRVILLEQLYRAERIRAGEPYHK